VVIFALKTFATISTNSSCDTDW